MIKTFKELQEVDQLVGRLYKADPNLKGSKFGYAYKRFTDKFYLPVIKEYQEAIINVRIDNALEDEKTKQVLTDPTTERGFKYSKAGLKDCILAEKDIENSFDAKEITVEPFVTSVIPEILTEDEKEILTGILY